MKYDHYIVEIGEPMSSNETLRVRIMLSNGRSVYFFGDNAQNVIDILNGDLKAIGDSVLREELRKRDEKIKVMQGQIEELTDVRDYLRKENNRLTGETTKFSNMIQERNKGIDILERRLANQANTIIDQNNAVDALKKKNAELIKENKQQDDTIEDQASTIRNLTEVLEEKEVEIKRLHEAGYGAKRGVYDLMNELKKLEMKNKELEGMYNQQCEVVKEQQKQLKGSHEYMHKLEKRIDEQKTTIDILEKSYAEAMGEKDKEIAKLKNSNEVLTNELYNELSERNCIATYELTISRLERRNKELEGIILKREERIGELMQHKEWLERNSFHGIAVCNGSIGEKVKYAVDNMKLEHENQKLRNKNNLLQAQNTRFRDACINAGFRLKELHTYLTSLDEE